MAQTPTTILFKSTPSLYNLNAISSPFHRSRFSATPLPNSLSLFRFSRHFNPPISIPSKRFCLDSSPISAVSDGGSIGNSGPGGGGGSSSDGDSRPRRDGDSGDRNCSCFSWYLIALEEHPVFTKALTSAFLNFVGDSICQMCMSG